LFGKPDVESPVILRRCLAPFLRLVCTVPPSSRPTQAVHEPVYAYDGYLPDEPVVEISRLGFCSFPAPIPPLIFSGRVKGLDSVFDLYSSWHRGPNPPLLVFSHAEPTLGAGNDTILRLFAGESHWLRASRWVQEAFLVVVSSMSPSHAPSAPVILVVLNGYRGSRTPTITISRGLPSSRLLGVPPSPTFASLPSTGPISTLAHLLSPDQPLSGLNPHFLLVCLGQNQHP